MIRRSVFFTVSGLISLWCLFYVNSSFGEDKPRFPISIASKTVGFVPVWAAWRMGFFDREGLAVDLVLMRGATILEEGPERTLEKEGFFKKLTEGQTGK